MGVDDGRAASWVREQLRSLRKIIEDASMLASFEELVADNLAPLDEDAGWSPEVDVMPGEDALEWLDYLREFSDGGQVPIAEDS